VLVFKEGKLLCRLDELSRREQILPLLDGVLPGM
jgi:hypothetical protein